MTTKSDQHDDYPNIKLTGQAYTENVELLLEGISSLPNPLSVGDLKLHYTMSRSGMYNMSNGYTNLGFGGYITASVWTGSKWPRLRFDDLIDEKVRSFDAKLRLGEAAIRTLEKISSLRGVEVTYVLPDNAKRKAYMLVPSASVGGGDTDSPGH